MLAQRDSPAASDNDRVVSTPCRNMKIRAKPPRVATTIDLGTPTILTSIFVLPGALQRHSISQHIFLSSMEELYSMQVCSHIKCRALQKD